MKKLLWISLALCSQHLFAQTFDKIDNPEEYVSPLMGADSKPDLSNGNTYPVIALPWGMNFWTPQTGKAGNGFIYEYDADSIRGFKQTHQASNWINDYGQFAIMPVTGLKFNENARASWFSHKTEVSKPYYYSVYLAEHNAVTEIAPTERAAAFQITYQGADSSYLVVDALNNGSYIKIIPEENKIIGYTTKNNQSVPGNFKNYFVLRFSQPFSTVATFSGDSLRHGAREQAAEHVGALVGFKPAAGQRLFIRVASSFISPEQAELNLKELGNDDFETVKQKAKKIWNKELSRIKIEGGTVDQARIFYTCLYRSLLFPRKFYERDNTNKIVHYSPYNGKVLPGYMFADNGFFDTFRALFPFFNLMYPEHNSRIMAGLVNAYNESGWLPEWSSPGHNPYVTFGAYSASIIADAYLKGVSGGYDINKLYEAILKNTQQEPPKNMPSVGRRGVSYYNELGYVPYNVNVKENTSRTLEYAYLDFAISRLAKALNRPKAEIDLLEKRSLNYKNHYDPSTGLMRGKNKNGEFQSPFNPFKWGDAFTEGNSWHYTWSVVNDMQGLVDLMGGKEKFVTKLDSVFTLPPVYDESYYNKVIHEIREMQIVNMGQYVHGNQPMQHVVYLYNYAGAPWKTQYWVREIMNRLYTPGADGYCGDEDTGQTSAWYVFSALGFYPVTPGTDQYVVGAPLFKKATIELPGGKQLVINAPGNSDKNKYISKLAVNGKPYTKNWLSHKELMKGGRLDFIMSSVPEKSRGVKAEDLPYSFSLHK